MLKTTYNKPLLSDWCSAHFPLLCLLLVHSFSHCCINIFIFDHLSFKITERSESYSMLNWPVGPRRHLVLRLCSFSTSINMSNDVLREGLRTYCYENEVKLIKWVCTLCDEMKVTKNARTTLQLKGTFPDIRVTQLVICYCCISK